MSWLRRAGQHRLGLALCVFGLAATPSVASADTVPTNDYNRWVIAEWRWRLSLPVTASKKGSCITRAQQGPVWFLAASATGRDISVRCVVPAGRSIMLNAPSVECSTVGRSALLAGSDAVLRRCARREWRRHPGGLSVILDGQALSPAGYIIATDAFAFRQPARGNLTDTPGRTLGRAAVYGSASILSPLSPGSHTLVERLDYSHTSVVQVVTYHLTVR